MALNMNFVTFFFIYFYIFLLLVNILIIIFYTYLLNFFYINENKLIMKKLINKNIFIINNSINSLYKSCSIKKYIFTYFNIKNNIFYSFNFKV